MNEVVPYAMRGILRNISQDGDYADSLLRAIAAEQGLPLEIGEPIVRCAKQLSPDSIPGEVRYWRDRVDMDWKALIVTRREKNEPVAVLLKEMCPVISAIVCARDLRAAQATIDEIRVALPERPQEEDGLVSVGYRFLADFGPQEVVRRLDAVRWSDIVCNYASETRAELAEVMSLRPDGLNGRLMIWHGEPGTGKTNALRALAYEWRKWCRVEYVVDPELFFGSSSYMMRVISGHDHIEKDSPWRVMVLEDTGEMLSVDAKHTTGQALSRLLNVADGLLGQSLKLLFLITTNEKLEKLQPALTRRGRCFSQIRFGRLSVEETRLWLTRAGSSRKNVGSLTIAELYSLLRDNVRSAPSRAIGFHSTQEPEIRG
jgi:hypothetical protein